MAEKGIKGCVELLHWPKGSSDTSSFVKNEKTNMIM